MKGIRVKIDDVKTSNEFDMIKLVVKIIAITKGLSLSDTELHALTYFVMNGYSDISREALITIKLFKNKSAVYNLICSFKKYGVVVKKNLGFGIHTDFNIYSPDLEVIKLEMLIKK